MQNNYAKPTSSTQATYGENYYAPVANLHNNTDLDSNSTQSSNTDAFNAQQADYKAEDNTNKMYGVYEQNPEQQQQRIQTVMNRKKPHNCGKCADCKKRKMREKEERRQYEQDVCRPACLIQCCLAVCQGFFYSTLGR